MLPPNLIDHLRERLTLPLPGYPAQQRMAPIPRATPHPPPHPPRTGSVLLLLYPHNGDWYFPLIERSTHVGTHRGQIALPGGACEPGENLIQTALREAAEEIGIDPTLVVPLGTLTPLYIPVSHFQVTPVLGTFPHRPHWHLSPVEVQSLLEVNLNHLCDPATIRVEHRTIAGQKTTIPFFALGPHRVWGATAMILAEFLALLDTSPPLHHPLPAEEQTDPTPYPPSIP